MRGVERGTQATQTPQWTAGDPQLHLQGRGSTHGRRAWRGRGCLRGGTKSDCWVHLEASPDLTFPSHVGKINKHTNKSSAYCAVVKLSRLPAPWQPQNPYTNQFQLTRYRFYSRQSCNDNSNSNELATTLARRLPVRAQPVRHRACSSTDE